MTVSKGPTLLGLPFIGLMGFLGAAPGGTWLMTSISRSNKENREKAVTCGAIHLQCVADEKEER